MVDVSEFVGLAFSTCGVLDELGSDYSQETSMI